MTLASAGRSRPREWASMRRVRRDPFDAASLRLAVAGEADALVSGDRDLLALSKRMPLPIVTLGEFVRMLNSQQG